MVRVCCTRCHMTWGTRQDRRWPCGCGCGDLVELGSWTSTPGAYWLEDLWDRNLIPWTGAMRHVEANLPAVVA